jgi:hypothetical protein
MSRSKVTHTFAAQQTPNAPHTAVAVATMPTYDDIAKRAFDIYVSTGRRQGHCKQNWQQAEQELRNQGMAACNSAQCSDESPDGLHLHQHQDRR